MAKEWFPKKNDIPLLTTLHYAPQIKFNFGGIYSYYYPLFHATLKLTAKKLSLAPSTIVCTAHIKSKTYFNLLNPFQPSVAYKIVTSHLIYSANQMNGFYME